MLVHLYSHKKKLANPSTAMTVFQSSRLAFMDYNITSYYVLLFSSSEVPQAAPEGPGSSTPTEGSSTFDFDDEWLSFLIP